MPGARVVDEGRSSRDGYELVVESFGAGAAAPLFVTVDATEAEDVVALAAADAGVVDARVVAPSGRERPGRGPGHAHHRGRRPGHLRPGRAPPRPASEATAAPAAVVGPAAQNHDLTKALTDAAPLAIGLIMATAFVLLLVVFRSLTIALSSILLNLLGVAASFGFATLVFQHGYGAALHRHRTPGLRRRLGAAVLLRPALRPLDGLPALPAGGHQGALRRHRRHAAGHPRGHRPHRTTDHQRRPHHDRGLRRLRGHRARSRPPSWASPSPWPSSWTPPSSG